MPRSRKSCTGKFKRLTRALRRFERLEDRRVLAAVSWDGGGADNDWSNPLNWSNDLLPTAADDVTLNSNNLIEFDIAAGATVASLDLQASLRVTQGALQVTGNMDVSSGRNLIVAGSTAALTSASGNIDGANIAVSAGGNADLGITSFVNAGVDVTWSADGPNSVLSLPNLTTITNGMDRDDDIFIQALLGGTVDLPNVTDMLDPVGGNVDLRSIQVLSQGAGSSVQLPVLQTMSDQRGTDIANVGGQYSRLQADQGGMIQLGMLTNVDGVYIPLDGTGTIDTSTITQLVNSRVEVSNAPANFSSVLNGFSTDFVVNSVDLNLSAMTFLDQGSLSIIGGTVQIPALTSINGTSLSVRGGVTLSIPNITSFTNEAVDVTWSADGPASILRLPDLTTVINGMDRDDDIFIQALLGGTVDLPNVTDMLDPVGGNVDLRSIQVLSQGAGSSVQLPVLQTMSDQRGTDIANVGGQYSRLQADQGGMIQLGMLTNVDGVYIPLDGTGTIDTSTITQLVNSRVEVSNAPANFSSVLNGFSTDFVVNSVDLNLSAMTFLDQGSLSIIGGTVQIPALTSINGTSLSVRGGVTLSIPNITSFTNEAVDVTWSADGPASILRLPDLTTVINGMDRDDDIFIQALLGGTVDLPNVTDMLDPVGGNVDLRSIQVLSQGAGSSVQLPALQTMSDQRGTDIANVGGQYSRLQAEQGGMIQLGMLTNVDGVYIPLDGTGTIDTSTITQLVNSRVEVSNAPANFSSVLNGFSTDFVVNSVDLNLSAMTFLDQGSLSIIGGTVQIPALTSINGTSLSVRGGVTLSIPNITSFTNEAVDVTWSASGLGSMLSLPDLTTVINGLDRDDDIFIQALLGGTVDLPNVTDMLDPVGGNVDLRSIQVLSQGAGSSVQLPVLQTMSDQRGTDIANVGGEYSRIQSDQGGTIELGQNTTVVGTYVPIDASSSIVAGRLTLGDSSLMSGAGEFFGTLHNSSTLQVAESGLRIHGDFEQTPTGVMQVAVSGAPAAGSYSMLDIDGFAQLDGNLELDLVGGFQPDLFSTYDVLRAATVNSQFSSLTGDNTAAPMIDDHYGASAVVLSRDFAAAPYNTMTYTNAVAGNRVFFNVLNTEDDAVEYRMYSPTGAFIFASNSTPNNPDLGDFGPITLGEVGDYEIRQYKDPAANPVTSYEIVAADIDVFQTALNSSETGALQNPGSIDLWQFDVPEAGEIRFHVLALEGDGPMQFKVRDAGGQIVFVAQENPGIGPRPQHMIGINNPGSYVLEVSGVGDSTGSYQFTLGESLVEVLVPLPSGVTHAIVSRDGNNVIVTDAAGPTVISSTPLAAAQSLTLVGSGAANQLVEIDFVTGGVFDLPGGIEVLGGASTSDELRILGDNAIQARHVSDDQVNLFHPDGVPNVRYSEMEERTFNGLLTFMAEGVLNIGSGGLSVESVTPVRLDGIVTLAGTGSLDATNSVVLAAGASLIGAGSVNAAFSGQTGSFIQATGNLAIGDGTSPIGFATDGVLEVGSHQVTLLDSNQAVLGSLTSLGVAGVQAGTVQSDHGFLIDFGNNVTGWGELQSPNLPADLVMHNGAINGNSVAEPVTLSGFVKGVGSVDFAEFTGTYTPGFSPAVIYNGSTTYAAGSTTIVELGGTSPGVGGHDQINHSGTATLGGTLQVDLIDSFAPVEGQSFVVMTAVAGIVGTFDDLVLPTPPAGTRWDVNYEANQLVLEVADAIPPAVSSVIVGSSSWGAPFIDTVDGGGAGAGNGLGYELAVDSAPLPWNDLDRIYVQFSEDVSGIIDSNVQLLDSNGLLNTSVVYDANTFTATISTPVLQFSKLRLGISDLVADQAGNALDGNDDQAAGGIFDLRFDVVPADANRDGRVNGSDFGPFSVAFLTQVGQANYNPFADWNADTRVNGSDLAIFSVNFLNSINTLADPDVPFSGGGGGEGESRSGESKYFGSKPGIDTFFGELGDQDEEEELFFSR